MPFNGQGKFNLISGINPFVQGTVIKAEDANSNNNDFAGGLSSALLRDGQAAMTGALPLADGTVASPALTWNSERTTGFFRPQTNSVAITAGGVEQGRWINGNMLLGTVSDSGERLNVKGNAKVEGNLSIVTTKAGDLNTTLITNITISDVIKGTHSTTGNLYLESDASTGKTDGAIYFNFNGGNGVKFGDGAGNVVASITKAGALTTTTINGTAITGTTFTGNGAALTNLTAANLTGSGAFGRTLLAADVVGTARTNLNINNVDNTSDENKPMSSIARASYANSLQLSRINKPTGDATRQTVQPYSTGSLLGDWGNANLQITSTAGNDAFIAFHIAGQFAGNFGMGSTGEFYSGGGSLGNGLYKFWTSRNFNPDDKLNVFNPTFSSNMYMQGGSLRMYNSRTNQTRVVHHDGDWIGFLGNNGDWVFRVNESGQVWMRQFGDLNDRIEARASAQGQAWQQTARDWAYGTFVNRVRFVSRWEYSTPYDGYTPCPAHGVLQELSLGSGNRVYAVRGRFTQQLIAGVWYDIGVE